MISLPMMFALLAIVVVAIAVFVYVRSRASGGEEELGGAGPDGLRLAVDTELTRLAREEGFDRRIVSVDGACGLALHPDGTRLLVVAPEVPGADPAPGESVPLFVRVYPAPDLLGVERRESDIARSDKDLVELRIRTLELHVFFDDTERPTHVLSLLDRSAKRMSKRHKEAAAVAATWEGLLRVVMRRGSTPRSLVVERAPERLSPVAERTTHGGPPPLPVLEPRAVTRVTDEGGRPVDAEAVRREQARQRLLQRARASQG